MTKVNREIVAEILQQMPQSKKDVLKKALDRNWRLTSSYVLSWCDLTIYKEGWYIQLTGTRANFSVFAKDNDGEFEITRKPVESKLHKLYSESMNMNESDYENI